MQSITENHDTVILAMHDVQLALQFCTRIIGISDGKIAFDRPVDRMKSTDLNGLYGTS